MMTNPSVGTRIKYIRELNHYTREELAKICGDFFKISVRNRNMSKRNVCSSSAENLSGSGSLL